MLPDPTCTQDGELVQPVSSYFQQYATTFPLISVDDMVRANFLLLDELGINKVHNSFLSISFSSSHIYIHVKVKNTYIL